MEPMEAFNMIACQQVAKRKTREGGHTFGRMAWTIEI
jgi:hypothetical protein